MNHESKIAKLQSQLAKAYAAKVKSEAAKVKTLVTSWGYKSLDEFIAKASQVSKALKTKTAPAAKSAKTGKRKRAVIDDKKRAAIVADLKTGKMTNGEVAEKHGVSVPSISNIKKAARLVGKK